jgi:hypothetical protein
MQLLQPRVCLLTSSRKQKCGGFTYDIKCRPCITRGVKCSFQEEVKDLRYNPYLRLRPSHSPPINADSARPDNDPLPVPASPAAIIPTLAAFDHGGAQPLSPALPAPNHGAPADEALPNQIDSLKSRFVLVPNLHIDFALTVPSIVDLESRLVAAQSGHADYIHTPPQSRVETSFVHQFEAGPTQPNHQSPIIS